MSQSQKTSFDWVPFRFLLLFLPIPLIGIGVLLWIDVALFGMLENFNTNAAGFVLFVFWLMSAAIAVSLIYAFCKIWKGLEQVIDKHARFIFQQEAANQFRDCDTSSVSAEPTASPPAMPQTTCVLQGTQGNTI